MSQFWQQRLVNANKFYQEWETKFKCDRLEKYYEGEQWKGRRDYINVNYNPYTLNLFYSTIKIKLANLIFEKPAFTVQARPGGQDWSPDLAMQSALLKQDVLNTVVQNPNANFAKHTKRSARDSFFRFGVLEVGYAADWRNPQKLDPLLSDHNDEPDEKARVLDNNDVPVNERFFFKRIDPKRFRVSVSDALDLNDHEWVGYYDFYYTKVLKRTKGIKFPSDYRDAIVSADYTDSNVFSGHQVKPDFLRLLTEGEISKVWNIWDMVEKKRILLLDGQCDPIWEGDCDRLPFKDLRWDERQEGFYPVPPAFQWLSPQDDINEGREQMRSFRRRFTRKFAAIKGKVEPDEVTKFASGPDGIVVEFIQPDGIVPIQNPEIGQTAQNDLEMAKDDFYTVSGNSANIQATDRQTATASKIVDQKAAIRESAEQMDFSVWLCEIGREALTQAQEYLVESLWIKYTTTTDPNAVLQDMQIMAPVYKKVTAQQIDDGYDYEIDLDVMNQTPAAMQAQQQSFATFVAFLHNYPELAMSPILIRKAAVVSGMRDERVIQQMQQVAALSMAAKAAQEAAANGQTLSQAGQAAGGGDNIAKTQVAQMGSPTAEQTEKQIQQQLM